MEDMTLKRELVAHKIYSAWQFIEYTEKNIATAEYCAETIDSLINKMSMETIRWEQDISSDFVDGVTEDGTSAHFSKYGDRKLALITSGISSKGTS